MVAAESENSQTPFEGRLSDPVRTLWLRYYPVSRRQRFVELLQQNIRPADHVLEIGAGSGTSNQNCFDLRGKVALYVGLDPDENVFRNPYLDEAHQSMADCLPFPDESFDVVFHYYVAEHLAEPMASHREIARVLKRGGLLLFQTPSRYWYLMLAAQGYAAVVSRILRAPFWFRPHGEGSISNVLPVQR